MLDTLNMTAFLAWLPDTARCLMLMKLRSVFRNAALSAGNYLSTRGLYIVSILRLLFECCPSYISRFIVAMSIWEAIKGVSRGWPRANIGIEVGESVSTKPFVGNGDAMGAPTSAIVRCPTVEAPRLNIRPDVIFRANRALPFMPMLEVHGNMITPFATMRAKK